MRRKTAFLCNYLTYLCLLNDRKQYEGCVNINRKNKKNDTCWWIQLVFSKLTIPALCNVAQHLRGGTGIWFRLAHIQSENMPATIWACCICVGHGDQVFTVDYNSRRIRQLSVPCCIIQGWIKLFSLITTEKIYLMKNIGLVWYSFSQNDSYTACYPKIHFYYREGFHKY